MSYSYIHQFSLLLLVCKFSRILLLETLWDCAWKKDAQLGISVHVHGCLCACARAYGIWRSENLKQKSLFFTLFETGPILCFCCCVHWDSQP